MEETNSLKVGSSSGSTYRLQYVGKGETLFLLLISNFFLKIITIGIYSPWAKTERRKYLWQNTHFDKVPFSYEGKGIEIFMGYLKLFGAYIVFLLLQFTLTKLGLDFARAGLAILAGCFFAFLVPVLICAALRYRLSRTTWNGIRFALAPITPAYTKQWLLGALLTVITLGLYAPIQSHHLHRIRTEGIRFGTEKFIYDGVAREEWNIIMKGFLVTLVTLGLGIFWAVGNLKRYRAAHTKFGEARFSLGLVANDYASFFLLGLFGVPLTLGIAFAWIQSYVLRRTCDSLVLTGNIDFSAIKQIAASGKAGGDAAVDFFGIDSLDFGIDI